jgi:hypothetical protein
MDEMDYMDYMDNISSVNYHKITQYTYTMLKLLLQNITFQILLPLSDLFKFNIVFIYLQYIGYIVSVYLYTDDILMIYRRYTVNILNLKRFVRETKVAMWTPKNY